MKKLTGWDWPSMHVYEVQPALNRTPTILANYQTQKSQLKCTQSVNTDCKVQGSAMTLLLVWASRRMGQCTVTSRAALITRSIMCSKHKQSKLFDQKLDKVLYWLTSIHKYFSTLFVQQKIREPDNNFKIIKFYTVNSSTT